MALNFSFKTKLCLLLWRQAIHKVRIYRRLKGQITGAGHVLNHTLHDTNGTLYYIIDTLVYPLAREEWDILGISQLLPLPLLVGHILTWMAPMACPRQAPAPPLVMVAIRHHPSVQIQASGQTEALAAYHQEA